MKLNKICIQHVKGISNKCFDLKIIPNKPSLLVAPNGFGKSSIATAFLSLNNRRINLHENHSHNGNAANRPLLSLEFLNDDNTLTTLSADDTTNTISNRVSTFVINNKIEAKGTRLNIGGTTSFRAELEIAPFVLINSIPARVNYNYTVALARQNFGANGKVLPNISAVLDTKKLINELSQNRIWLERSLGARIQTSITDFTNAVNAQNDTREALLQWIEIHQLPTLQAVNYLNNIAQLIGRYDFGYTNPSENYLAAIQIISVFQADRGNFDNATKRVIYELEKEDIVTTFNFFNATWKNARPTERAGKLILELPKNHHISNGQRDVLSFLAMLLQAKSSFKKDICILIIDEVFDYLDDANLISVQYYVSKFIEQLRAEGKTFFPLILTHLNPFFFRNYVFKNQKVYFLDTATATPHPSVVTLVRGREIPLVKDDIARALFHYDPIGINRRADFAAVGLRETWGDSANFHIFINGEFQKYVTDQPNYCPLAVCCAVRVKIENHTYQLIGNAAHQTTFLNTHGTNDKLTFADSIGINVPEPFYLLGIIYNDGMHWRNNSDNITPIVANLKNTTIKKMLTDIYHM